MAIQWSDNFDNIKKSLNVTTDTIQNTKPETLKIYSSMKHQKRLNLLAEVRAN